MKKVALTIVTLISILLNQSFAQVTCSAPYKAEYISANRNSIWIIGESDEKGRGVFKYENMQWRFYGQKSATEIAVSKSNQPLVIDQNKNLLQYENSWNIIASGVSAMAGSVNTSNIWAIIDNNLKFYRNNNWYEPQNEQMLIKSITEDQNGHLYVLNGSGYPFKLNGNSWDILGNKKGEKIYATRFGEIYLVSNEFTNSGNTIYKRIGNNWSNTNYKGKSLAVNQNRAVFLIDGFGQLFLLEKGNRQKLTIDKITTGGTNSNGGNFDYGTNVNAVDSMTGETSLFKAVANNDLPGIYTLLSKKSNINKINNTGQTPLIKAITLDHTDIAIALIGLKANLEITDKKNKNALSHACGKGDLKVVEELINKGAKVSSGSPLNYALNLKADNVNKVNIIEALINAKVKINITHLEKTVSSNDDKAFKLLNQQDSIINLKPTDYNQFLKIAIQNKNIEIVKECVNEGADSNEAMNFAATQNNKDLMIFCMKNGADANVPIDYAINKDDMDLFILCLQDFNASKDKALQQALRYKKEVFARKTLELGANADSGMLEAIKTKNINFVKMLFEYEAKAEDSIYIIEAVNIKNLEIVQLLINNGADANNGTLAAVKTQQLDILVELMKSATASSAELIEEACKRNNTDIVILLLDKGADPANGISPAVNNNKLKNLRELIQRGADVSDDKYIKTSAAQGYVEITKLLVENGANANIGLMPAVKKNNAKIVAYLIAKGADISDKSIIITAVSLNYVQTVNVLLENKVDLSVKDPNNNNLLHLSGKNYSLEISSKIVETGKVDINGKNNNGLSPLMIIVMNSKGKTADLCRVFVQNGADINARNSEFEPIYKMAKGRKVKKFLKDNGAVRK